MMNMANNRASRPEPVITFKPPRRLPSTSSHEQPSTPSPSTPWHGMRFDDDMMMDMLRRSADPLPIGPGEWQGELPEGSPPPSPPALTDHGDALGPGPSGTITTSRMALTDLPHGLMPSPAGKATTGPAREATPGPADAPKGEPSAAAMAKVMLDAMRARKDDGGPKSDSKDKADHGDDDDADDDDADADQPVRRRPASKNTTAKKRPASAGPNKDEVHRFKTRGSYTSKYSHEARANAIKDGCSPETAKRRASAAYAAAAKVWDSTIG